MSPLLDKTNINPSRAFIKFSSKSDGASGFDNGAGTVIKKENCKL